jgi:DNA-binding NarL/FixJ family response regulator
VLDVGEFMEAAERVQRGGSALDPQVVATLLSQDSGGASDLTPREREVLSLMAEGLTNAGIASRLVLTERTVESHTRNVFSKLDLSGAEDGHRRVLAVLSYLKSGPKTQ